MSQYIRKSVQSMTGYAPGEQPRGRQVIKLNTNENPYPPSPRIAKLLRDYPLEKLGLYPDPVAQDLRATIASIHGCDIEQVFVGNGSDEILALCIRAFVERDGTVGYFDPSYSLYPVLAEIEEVAVRPVPLGPAFEWSMPDDYSASLFFLANPNAPTSLLYPKHLVDGFCRRFGGVVLLDEAYVDFSREHGMDLALSLPNVLAARTLSKSFSLAGIRLGYAVGPRPLIEALFKVKDSYNVSRLTQEMAKAALSDLPHMESNVDRIKLTRDKAGEDLARRGFEVFPSETNFLWVKPDGITAADLYRKLRDDGILVRHFTGERTRDHLRISVGSEGEMRALLDAIDRILGR